MAVSTTAGTKFYIGPVVNPDTIGALSDEDAVTFFEAFETSDWTEVEEVEDLGEFGDTSEEITFTALGNRRVRKMKGPRNAGTQNVVVGRDPLDPGQQAMVAAEKTDFDYAFRVEYADARDENHTDSVEYFGAKVMSRAGNLGNVSNVTRRTFGVGINTAVYAVDSEVITSP
jgi:hypothetical protein